MNGREKSAAIHRGAYLMPAHCFGAARERRAVRTYNEQLLRVKDPLAKEERT